ncbi:MAG: DUF4255 domain-containing protein [Planctomycetes bacterium]|nr:DUF4255 domain-containing protein [Planctomycetota bacterium]
MVAVSSLSVAANELRTLLQREIVGLDITNIRIGHPKQTFENIADGENYLNLFFYNVQYDGYPTDGLSENPFYVRLYCLITPLGAKATNSTPSAGENDLRLVGEVMRVLHEQPMISVNDGNNDEIAQLQIVPHKLDLDKLNHIWSTQGDTAYRLSIAYEMALAPVPLAEAFERSPRVGETGASVRDDMDRDLLPDGGFGIETSAPVVPKVTVDVRKPDWSPHICFVDEANSNLAYTLLVPKSQLPTTGLLPLKVLVAGKPSNQVELAWESWNPSTGWKKAGSSQNETIETDTIDPENFDPGLTADIDLPIADKGQATLYAERAWERPDGSTVTLRSNPLLVTVYEVGT